VPSDISSASVLLQFNSEKAQVELAISTGVANWQFKISIVFILN
jgi:hypothetical protein